MKYFTLGILCLLLSCCTLELAAPEPQGPVYYPEQDSAYVEVIYHEDTACWDEQYLYPTLWCDWYDDNTTCCVWWVEDYEIGWYEEWCQWEDDWCWTYNGVW